MTSPGGLRDRFSGHRRVSVHLPFAIVMVVAAIGFLRIGMQHWREGAALLGSSLILAALLRAFLPNGRAGLLAIRSRPVDLVLYSVLGLLIVADAVTIKGGIFG